MSRDAFRIVIHVFAIIQVLMAVLMLRAPAVSRLRERPFRGFVQWYMLMMGILYALAAWFI